MRTIQECLAAIDGPAPVEFPIADIDLLVDVIGAAYGSEVDSYLVRTGDAGEPEMKIHWPDGTVDYLSQINQWPDRSLEAVVKLVPRGWWWRVGVCDLSCDAAIGPDYNGSESDRLHREFPEEIWSEGFSEDLRPGGSIPRTCQAMLACILTARLQMAEVGL